MTRSEDKKLSKLILAVKLAKNGLLFRYRQMTGKPSKIQALSLEVTGRCVARCIMCNIWKTESLQTDLPAEKWLELLSSPLFSEIKELDVTGGEPFLRDDLDGLIKGVCLMKMTRLQKLRSIAITTNGFLTERILSLMPYLLDQLAEHGLDMVIACALDGVGEVHDRIRRHPDAFSKVDRTIKGLLELRSSRKNLVIGIKTTILPQNVGELEKLSNYAEDKGLFTIISPVILTGNRYRNLGLKDAFAFDEVEINRIISFLSGGGFKWDFHRDFLLRYFRSGKTDKPCSAGHNYIFIRSNGDVFACPLVKLKLGNFLEEPLEKILRADAARDFRMNNGKFPECRSCTEPGLERYALPFEGFSYLGAMIRMGGEKFSRFHEHMGLDKYV